MDQRKIHISLNTGFQTLILKPWRELVSPGVGGWEAVVKYTQLGSTPYKFWIQSSRVRMGNLIFSELPGDSDAPHISKLWLNWQLVIGEVEQAGIMIADT